MLINNKTTLEEIEARTDQGPHSRTLHRFYASGWHSRLSKCHCLGDDSPYSFRCLDEMPVGKAGIARCCAVPSMPEELPDQEEALAGHDGVPPEICVGRINHGFPNRDWIPSPVCTHPPCCCSACNFDPAVSSHFNSLSSRSARNPRADQHSYVVEESQDWPRYTRAIALRETWMRWPWQRRERRASGGDFSDAVIRLIEAQAAGAVADASSTVAVEAASGALSRAFASPGVVLRGRLGARMPFSGRPGANGARSNPVGRLDARDAQGRRRNGAVDSGFVPALRRLARSGDVDRARNGLRAEHFDDLESVGVGCSAPNFDPMDSTDVNRLAADRRRIRRPNNTLVF